MAQQQPAEEEPPAAAPALAPDVAQRTSMAAERTWLAWWRTALGATAGALAVGRVAPQVLDTATWPYVALGVGYAVLAVGLLLAGAHRQRVLGRAVVRNEHDPLRFGLVMLFTVAGIVLALATIVLVIAQS
jgi:putative membrane protein